MMRDAVIIWLSSKNEKHVFFMQTFFLWLMCHSYDEVIFIGPCFTDRIFFNFLFLYYKLNLYMYQSFYIYSGDKAHSK